ncbi:MAG TPA: DNA-processing protein DprA, partial [Bacteroidia bacterium]|nr:DNA-processing protein DprA [Bacteroidia bacterium]
MNHPDELLKMQIALSLIPGIGPVLARNLVSYCGSVPAIFSRKKTQLERIPGIGSERAELVTRHKFFPEAEREVTFIRKHKITPLFYLDAEYPYRLKNCDDAPVILFYKGTQNLNVPHAIAVVGTRHITGYGKEMTEKLVEGLIKYQALIVSGMAYGVDIAAHKSALKNQLPTVAVTAHGLDRIYPSVHKSTA